MLRAINSSLPDSQKEIDVKFHGMNVLVVDNEEINLFMMRSILEMKGIQVTLADSGKKALQTAQQERFDLVLMDLRMPGLDGMETTRLFRASPLTQLSEIPIIGVTADVLKKSRKMCLKSGMNLVISKPFQFDDLFQNIQSLVK